MAKQRIEYIDAIRGFCMILVVLYHVGMFSYETNLPNSYYHVFNFFMLPLFFFVSGWCCYRKDQLLMGVRESVSFCARKFRLLSVRLFWNGAGIYVFQEEATIPFERTSCRKDIPIYRE